MDVPFSSYYDYDDVGNIDLRDKRENEAATNEHVSSVAGSIQNMTICLCCSGDHGAFKKKTLYVQDQVCTALLNKLAAELGECHFLFILRCLSPVDAGQTARAIVE